MGPTTHPIYLVFANNIDRCWKKKKKGEKKRKERSGDMTLKRIAASEGTETYSKELNEELIWMESAKQWPRGEERERETEKK